MILDTLNDCKHSRPNSLGVTRLILVVVRNAILRDIYVLKCLLNMILGSTINGQVGLMKQFVLDVYLSGTSYRRQLVIMLLLLPI